jgi:integrase
LKKTLTDALVRSIAAPESGRLEISDLRCAGLSLRVTAAGARSWCLRFRDPATGKTSRSTIGSYPDVTLAEARDMADRLRVGVAKGQNPVETKRQGRIDAAERTFQQLADRYLDEHARRKKRSAAEDERNLKLHILPRWAKRRYDEITRGDVIELIESMIKKGQPTNANRVHSLISKMFSFAVDSALVPANPCARLKKRGVEKVGERVLSPDEIKLFWARAVVAPVSPRVGLALRLALVTATRVNEVAGMRRRELSDLADPAKATWTIPKIRSKNGKEHLVPLSPLARSLVLAALELVDKDEDCVFPSRTNDGLSISGHALSVAMRRMASKLPAGDASTSWVADAPSPHDLRRTAATNLSRLGIPAEDISAVLSHVRSDVTGRHYDKHQREAEKRHALTRWSSEVERICGLTGAGATVLPLRTTRRI